MLNARQIDDMVRRVVDKLPVGVREIQQDIDKNVHAALQGALVKLDLVTREEFEVQSAVLLRTREKLAALEARVAELEHQANHE